MGAASPVTNRFTPTTVIGVVTAALVGPTSVAFAHVGDSRAYLEMRARKNEAPAAFFSYTTGALEAAEVHAQPARADASDSPSCTSPATASPAPA